MSQNGSKNNGGSAIAFVLPMIAFVGIMGFFGEVYALTYIAGVILATGMFVNFFTKIVAAILGWMIVGDFFLGVTIGICFEQIIVDGIGLVLMQK